MLKEDRRQDHKHGDEDHHEAPAHNLSRALVIQLTGIIRREV